MQPFSHASFSNLPASAIQQVLISDDGTLLFSNDQLIALSPWLNKKIVTNYPFLESIFQQLLHIENDNFTHFPTVGLSIENNFMGYFQYFFKKINENNQQKLLWIILKNEDAIEERSRQQSRQEKQMSDERKKLRANTYK